MKRPCRAQRDVRNAIQTSLQAQTAFDGAGVWLFSPEDRGEGTDVAAARWIEPVGTSIRSEWDDSPDGGITMTASLRITFAFRGGKRRRCATKGSSYFLIPRPTLLNGQVLVPGFTIPAWTRFLSWSWSPPESVERKIVSMFSYQYLVEGWDSFDTTE